MQKWRLLLAVLPLALVGLFAWLWFAPTPPRFSYDFDIGGGRSLRVWSEGRDEWYEYGALLVYYRIHADGHELVHKTFLNHDDKGKYEFRVVQANGGRLACVCEITRAADNQYFLLMYDAESNESWPRLRSDETTDMPRVLAKWRERHRRIKAEHPEVPAPAPFDK